MIIFFTIINFFELWKFELYNIEKPVQIITDNKNLEYFISNKYLNRRQNRWSEILFKFNFEIIYKPGSMNNKADVFTYRFKEVLKKSPVISMANDVEKKYSNNYFLIL